MPQPSGELLRSLLEQQPELRSEVRDFCGVNSSTVRTWILGTNPKGLVQAKLFVFLIRAGFTPLEISKTDQNLIRLMALVANGYIVSTDAVKVLGSTSPTDQQLWRWFRNAITPLPPAMQKLADWLSESDDSGSSRAQLADRLLTLPIPGMTTQEQSLTPPANQPMMQPTPVVPTASSNGSAGNEVVIKNLASLLEAVYPLAKRAEADDFSDADRQRLRAIVGEDQFFRLTNALTRLSGAKARSYTQSI